jgi:SAM-dependent methyltransferase
MDKAYESVYHTEEEKNWWFVARRDMLIKFFDKYRVPKDARILDIGCAAGTFLLKLKELGYTELYALDYSPEAIELVKKAGIEQAYVMDGHYPDFPEQTFDVIIASDSLEHLEKDEVALKNWHAVLKNGGIGFVLVPAYNFLWSEHDDVNFHFRRYTKTDLKQKAIAAGFKILFSGYNYVLLFIPTAAVRLLMKLFKRKKEHNDSGQILMLPNWVNNLLIFSQKIENSLSKHISFPFGVSSFIVIKK